MDNGTPLIYDLAIIGGGSAGLTAASVARALGAHVALIEGQHTGGECTWTGCVPSKALLSVAKLAHQMRHAADYGIQVDDVAVDFGAAMDYVHRIVREIYAEETPQALRSQGLHVYEEYAHFIGDHTVALNNGTHLAAKNFLLCTGAKPRVPEGFTSVPYLTNETLFELKEQPRHLMIVGGGPVGVEMAQAFRRLGSAVTILSRTDQILPRDEPEAAQLLMDILQREGVTIKLGVAAERASGSAGDMTVHLEDGTTVTGDVLLLAVGKTPNLEKLNLAAAGVETQKGKLVLDERLRTTQEHIYAAGDVVDGPKFTHYAGWQSVQAVRSMLLPGTPKIKRAVVPWTTFTDPEVAHTGQTEKQSREEYGSRVRVTQLPMTRSDRAMVEGKPTGFMKLVHKRDGHLLGATIVGMGAGEMINEWTRVLEKGGRVWDAAGSMRVYPTQGTANVALATEQIKGQLDAGLLGRTLRWISHLSS